jgi:hypothetical protein
MPGRNSHSLSPECPEITKTTEASMQSADQPHEQPFRVMRNYTSRTFVTSAGAILALTGLAKIWSAFGKAQVLEEIDPIVGIKFGHLMLGAGVVEVAIAIVCCFARRWETKYLLLAWLATMIAGYRFALWYIDWRIPCSCLGSFADALRLSPQTADGIMKGVLAYLGIGAYLLYAIQWMQKRRMQAVPISTLEG